MYQTSAFWTDRRVFVTGCTGFLGTWVVRELLAAGADVTGLIRGKVSDSDLIRDRLFDRLRVVRGPVEDGMRLRQTLAIHEIDAVFHLAGPPADAPDRAATAARWLDTVRSAMRISSPSAVLVAPVRSTEATAAPMTGRWPQTVLAPIPSRTPGPDAAHLLLAAAERAVGERRGSTPTHALRAAA